LKKVILISLILSALNTFCQKIENGTYIAYKGGILQKYVILTVNNDSASLEAFSKWQGSWLPIIGAWDSTYKAQNLIHIVEYSLKNENVFVRKTQKDKIIGILKNSFAGTVKLKFKKVDTIPKKYLTIKTKALKFTQRN